MDNLIEGVLIVDLKIIGFKGNAVLHMFKSTSSIFQKFGEIYFSEISSQEIRAWKKHNFQTQNICVPVGSIKLVIYDEREGSNTFNNLMEIDFGRDIDFKLVKIPKGIWYGFKGLSNDINLIANCTDIPHDPLDNITLSHKESEIPYKWY